MGISRVPVLCAAQDSAGSMDGGCGFAARPSDRVKFAHLKNAGGWEQLVEQHHLVQVLDTAASSSKHVEILLIIQTGKQPASNHVSLELPLYGLPTLFAAADAREHATSCLSGFLYQATRQL